MSSFECNPTLGMNRITGQPDPVERRRNDDSLPSVAPVLGRLASLSELQIQFGSGIQQEHAPGQSEI